MHKLVAVVSAQATNLFIPGIRFENEFQFAGLQKYSGRISYPSRALNLPRYPFFCIGYKDVPINIFDNYGSKIASYKDRSTRLEIGMGLLFTKIFNAEIQYQHEYMNIKPEIAMPDEETFPNWEEELHKIEATINFDYLDDVLLPRCGFQIFGVYETGLKKLKSETSFSKKEISGDFYFTFLRRNTIRLFGFYGECSRNTPIYKYFNKGRPYTFVGMNYDQLFASKIKIARLDYRYEFKKDIFLKVIANAAFDAEFGYYANFAKFHNLYGAGAGVKLISPVGLIEIIFSRGSKSLVGSPVYQNLVYFTMGYKF